MDLATVFKLSLYGLTALVGWILGAAEDRSWLPYYSLPFVLLGFWWCEVFGKQRPREGTEHAQGGRPQRGLSDELANACGVIAITFAGQEFVSGNHEGKLLAGTHLLVYLTWIVSLQHKTTYRCWLLLALGVLQIAVAAVLSPGSWFGVCLVGYMFVATWTLSVFSLCVTEERFAENISSAGGGISGVSENGNLSTTAQRSANAFISETMSSIQQGSYLRWSSWRFTWGVMSASTAGLIVSLLLFILIPRAWVGTPVNFDTGGDVFSATRRSISGFSSDVRLGDLGTILESVEPVMELRLTFPRTGNTMSPRAYAERLGTPEPLFRGAVLTTYFNHRWLPDRLAEQSPQEIAPTRESTTVRQEIRLEPISTDILFCMGRPTRLIDQQGRFSGRYRTLSDLAFRGSGFPRIGAARYTVDSELPVAHQEEPAGLDVSPELFAKYLSSGYLRRNGEIPGRLVRLTTLASKIVGDEVAARGRPITNLETARALEAHLRDSGEYKYSLSLSVQDALIDPVEDFLFNRKEGHCEYFASALVLMLRSVGIPARLVTGFKGGELRPDQTLVIQQRFAHAWAEALIDRKVWVTLDGTPDSERTASVANVAARRSVWTDVSSRVSNLWSANVVNISMDTQEEVLYGPARELVTMIWEGLASIWISPESSLEAFVQLIFNPRNWLSFGGAAVLWLGVSSLWFLRHRLRGLRLGWSRKQRSLQTTPRRWIEFYERFVRLMKSRGLERDPTQTHHEFSARAAETFAAELCAVGLNEVPLALSRFFCRVRFGDELLSKTEALEIDLLLTQLEAALTPTPRSPR